METTESTRVTQDVYKSKSQYRKTHIDSILLTFLVLPLELVEEKVHGADVGVSTPRSPACPCERPLIH